MMEMHRTEEDNWVVIAAKFKDIKEFHKTWMKEESGWLERKSEQGQQPFCGIYRIYIINFTLLIETEVRP